MTRAALSDPVAWGQSAAGTIKGFVVRSLEKRDQRIADLERRLIVLERRLENERKGFFYRGVWTEGETYTEGDFVTDHGGMWHCNAATLTRPGSCDAWQLAVKAGRDRRR